MTYAKVQRRVPIGQNQYGSSSDAANFGIFAVGAMDALGADIVGPDAAWTEMAVIQESTSSVRVNFGRVWKDGKFFGNPDATTQVINLITVMPTSTKKIVTIFATGAEAEANILPRSFKNTTTGAKQTQNVATEIRRAMTLSYVGGAEAGTPQAPDLDANYVPIANVVLGMSGIESIEMLTDYQLPTQQGMQSRLLSLETFRQTIGSRVETLASDLALTNEKIGQVNAPLLKLVARRLAEIEDLLGVNDEALLYGYDRFLTDDESDTAAVGYSARIDEGLRFPFAASDSATPAKLNPADPRVVTLSGWTLPVHQDVKRLDIWGQYISVNVSSYQYANTSFTIFPGATRRRRYGTSMVVSENSTFWQSAKYGVNYLTKTFTQGSETWLITDSWIDDDTGVTQYRVQQYWDDQIKYWNGYQSITPTAANGYLVGQTFLNAQAGWLTKIGLRFAKVDDAHAVKVFVCKAKDGQPDVTQVISTGTLTAGSAKASTGTDPAGIENVCTLTPAFLNPGERYAVMVVTGGDFAVACRSDNALSNGAFFIGDGSAWVADLGKDMNMRLYFADFSANYAEVSLQTVTLSGGITDFDIITREHVPEGCELYFEVQIAGSWVRLERNTGTHPLAAKPVTLPMRMVMVGTREVMPAIKLAESTINFHRGAAALTHFSEIRDVGTNVTNVEVKVRLVNWNGAKHTLTTTVLSGANTDSPDATTDEVQPDGSIIRTMTFTPAATDDYQIKFVGATTDIADPFVVAWRYDEAAA
jgi:hypothetical protein